MSTGSLKLDTWRLEKCLLVLLQQTDCRVRSATWFHTRCLLSFLNAASAGGVMMWGMFTWHIFGPLIPAYLCIVADYVHLFMAIFPSFYNRYLHDNALSQSRLRHDHEFGLQWPSSVTVSEPNRSPVGCGRVRDPQHDTTSDKSVALLWWSSWYKTQSYTNPHGGSESPMGPALYW